MTWEHAISSILRDGMALEFLKRENWAFLDLISIWEPVRGN